MSKMMLNKLFGVIPYLMKQIGFSSGFYGTKDSAMWTLIGVDAWWQTAFVFIIILAGLQSIPKEPIEAARIDGVSEWGITPNNLFNIILDIKETTIPDIIRGIKRIDRMIPAPKFIRSI